MAYSSQTSPFAAILIALRDKLVADLGFDESRVVVMKRGGYAIAPLVENFIAVRPLAGLYSADHGGGRLSTPVSRIVAVDIYTRCSIDEYGSDYVALTEDSLGFYAIEEAVAESLLFKMLMSDADTPAPLLIEVLHPIREVEDAEKPDPQRFVGCLLGTLYWEVRYGLRVNSLPD